MPTPTNPALENLKKALALAEHIQKLELELKAILGGSSPAPAPAALRSSPIKIRGRRTMSPATIAKMRAAQQARWAKKKGTTASSAPAAAPKSETKPAPTPKKKKKGKLSPEGRASIVAALKARWAAKKKAAK